MRLVCVVYRLCSLYRVYVLSVCIVFVRIVCVLGVCLVRLVCLECQ